MATVENEYFPSMVFHPGETLAEKLDELSMGPKEFAVRTDKPEKTIIAVLKGKSSITPEMAVQFEHVLKIPAHFWLNKQRSYDEFIARQKRNETLKRAEDWANEFPVTEMAKRNWLPVKLKGKEKVSALLKFFSLSNPAAWVEYYFHQQLKVAFRISLKHTQKPHAISAWLRKGELQAGEIVSYPYDDTKFKAALPKIKVIMANHPETFFYDLQRVCIEAGVKVVFTECLSKAPVSGCTRWLNDIPLIQLTDRYKRNDIFWFTFFHEAGHILLHGKKDIFLENIDYSDKDQKKEKEADDFAIKWTFSKEEESEVLAQSKLTEKDIINFAKKFHTHPAMIIGRLQHLGKIPYTYGHRFIKPVNLAITSL